MKIALTYDDGPNEPYTRQILDVLREFGAKATFFVIGKWVRQFPAQVREIASNGHQLGNHTENHQQFSQISQRQRYDEWLDCDNALDEAGISGKPWLLRLPFGDVTDDFRALHTRWDIHGGDWAADSVEAITQPIFEHLDKGQDSIVLLHDGYYKEFGADRSKTVEATRRILERYRDAEFVTISGFQS